MPFKVVLLNDPVLRMVCVPVITQNLGELLPNMYATMVAEQGIGLAANQVGFPLRIFILKRDDTYDEYINPEIVSQENLVTFDKEACLSIPGTFGVTQRYSRVKLRWQTKEGTTKEDTFEDMKAFAVQHEMDHLNGKLYIDQFSPLKRDMVVSKHKKYMRGLKRV